MTIYLTRHGMTEMNQLEMDDRLPSDWKSIPGIFNLTEAGEFQAHILGQYLCTRIGDSHRTRFITTKLQRNIHTARIVASELNIDLNHNNHYASNSFIENYPRECLPLSVLQDPDPQVKKWVQQHKSLQEIGELVQQELLAIGGKKTDVVAILNHSINTIFLQSLGVVVPSDYQWDNCGLYVLEIEGRKISRVGSYQPYAVLAEEIKTGKLVKKTPLQKFKIGGFF